jgi:hypothetical protein
VRTTSTMTLPARFDRRRGKGAFARLRSMLNDSQFAYQQIANKFGFTRQYIARLAKQLGIDGHQRRRQRERLRMLRREPRVIKIDYPVGIQAVIDKIRRRGIQVTPYIFPAQPRAPYLARRSQTMVLVNGRLCTIQFRKSRKRHLTGVSMCVSILTFGSGKRTCLVGDEKRSCNQSVRRSTNSFAKRLGCLSAGGRELCLPC